MSDDMCVYLNVYYVCESRVQNTCPYGDNKLYGMVPLLDVLLCDWLRGDPPGTEDPPPRQPVEVKLTADGWVGTAGVRDIVTVEGHHVTRDVTEGGGV